MSQADSMINGFTPGAALAVFSPDMLDHHLINAWVYDKLHPGDVICCPACGDQIKSDRACSTFEFGGRVCCPSCKKFFTNRTDTILHGSQLSFGQVYLIAVLSALKVERREIARIVGLHPDSIRNWEKIFTALETPLV